MKAKVLNKSVNSNKNYRNSNKKMFFIVLVNFFKGLWQIAKKIMVPIKAIVYHLFFNIKTKSLKYAFLKGGMVLAIVYWVQSSDLKINITYGDQESSIAEEETIKAEVPSFNALEEKKEVAKKPSPKAVLTSQKSTNPYAPVGVKDLKNDKVYQYIKRFEKVAVMEMKKYGVPASIKLAQGIIESRSGNSKLAQANNNHFGMKCFSKQCTKGHCSNFNDDHHKDFFRKYNSAWESWRAHSKMLAKSSRYKQLFQSTDYKKWAKGLKNKGYATDKNYDKKLINVIEKYQLHKYDKGF